jgi:hypothetical protein
MDLAVYDRRSETLRRRKPAGKSETCRASEWQSHQASSAESTDAQLLTSGIAAELALSFEQNGKWFAADNLKPINEHPVSSRLIINLLRDPIQMRFAPNEN